MSESNEEVLQRISNQRAENLSAAHERIVQLEKQLAECQALLSVKEDALKSECGGRCNAEYNPCHAREALDKKYGI